MDESCRPAGRTAKRGQYERLQRSPPGRRVPFSIPRGLTRIMERILLDNAVAPSNPKAEGRFEELRVRADVFRARLRRTIKG